MNLPNAVTIGRIAATPLIAWLPLAPSSALRFVGFWLFIITAVTDYVDGHLARSRKEETDLGRLLDPLADKLLLIATCYPMFMLMRPTVHEPWPANVFSNVLPFRTPFGEVPLPWWLLAIVIGREVFMTIFRQIAARRGVVISAIGPAKLKTFLQWNWVGAAYFWFGAALLAANRGWDSMAWNAFANFNGLYGVVAMIGSIALTLYSLGLYLRRYGRLLTTTPVRGRS